MKTRRELLHLQITIAEHICDTCGERRASVLSGLYGDDPMCQECANEYRYMMRREMQQLKNDLRTQQ